MGINVVCWGVPLCFAAGTIGSKTVGYVFSGSCGPSTNLQIGLFLVPSIVIHLIYFDLRADLRFILFPLSLLRYYSW
jgi:hypothetical protein